MFQHFLREYKYSVYKGDTDICKLIPWYEWVLFAAVLLIVLIAIAISAFASENGLAYILMSIGAVLEVVEYFLNNHRVKKNRELLYKRYQEKRLQPLRDLLESAQFHLEEKTSIQWLICCCDATLAQQQDANVTVIDSFMKYIFPFITLYFGYALSQLSLSISLAAIIVFAGAFLLVYFMKWAIKPIINIIRYPDKDAIQFLKSELEYIMTTL